MRPTFKETLDKLIHWYLNDELQHGDCAACVVGNLCGGRTTWRYLFQTDSIFQEQKPDRICSIVLAMECAETESEVIEKATNLCNSTGYSVDELSRIEYAFETARKGNSEDDYMFNGLCAVVDILAGIHSVDLSIREEAKLLFVKV